MQTSLVDARDWDARYAAAELLWSAGPNRFLAQEAAGLTSGRALDLACGEGRNAIWLAEQGWCATGVDFSEVAIERGWRIAAERGLAAAPGAGPAAGRVALQVADLLAYEPEPEGYDLVAVFYLQLPAAERARVLAAAGRAVAPGGTLLVVGHDLLNLTEGVGGPKDTAALFTPADVVAEACAPAGLVVEKAQRVTRPVGDGQVMRDAIDALVRARRPGARPPRRLP